MTLETQGKELEEESTINNNNQDEHEQSDVGGAKRKRSASHSADEGPKRKQVRSSGSVVRNFTNFVVFITKDHEYI